MVQKVMEIRARGTGCLIIFAFCLVACAMPAAAWKFFKCPFKSVENSIILHLPVLAFVGDFTAKTQTEKSKHRHWLIWTFTISFVNTKAGHSPIMLMCNEFTVIQGYICSLWCTKVQCTPNNEWCSQGVQSTKTYTTEILELYQTCTSCISVRY